MINRKRIAILVKFAVSVVLVWALMRAVGAGEAYERMLELRPEWFIVALCLGVVQIGIGVVRWQAVLLAIGATLAWPQIFRFTYIGAFFNQTLPSSVGGDAVRGYMSYRSGLDLGVAVNGILLDRLATVFALIVLVAVMVPFGAAELDQGEWFSRTAWALLAMALVGLTLVMVLDRLPTAMRRFRLVTGLSMLAADARRVFLQPRHTVLVMGWSILGHVNLSVIVFTLGYGLGVEVTLIDCLLLFPPVLMAQTLPISVAGWGVREGAMVALFALAGVSGENALAISILFGFGMILVSLPGSIFWLAAGSKTVKEVEAFSER